MVTPVSNVVVTTEVVVFFIAIVKSLKVYGLVKAEMLKPTAEICDPADNPNVVSSAAV